MSQDRTIERVSEAGSVQGIRVPRQRNLQFTPYVLGSAERGGMLSGTETNEEFGFDIKYSITPSLTLDATYNTDFAQVEVDDQQVNLDRFSLFFSRMPGNSLSVIRVKSSCSSAGKSASPMASPCRSTVAFACRAKSAARPMSVCCSCSRKRSRDWRPRINIQLHA
jgi:hypothetical protein